MWNDGERFTYQGEQFLVRTQHDDTANPFDDDGHGVVTDWLPVEGYDGRRTKRPGWKILATDGRRVQYYDVPASMKKARAEGWGCTQHAHPRRGEEIACAVEQDYKYLRAWCADEWGYIGIEVSWISPTGEDTTHARTRWGVEDREETDRERIAHELADELIATLPEWAGKEYARAAETLWSAGA